MIKEPNILLSIINTKLRDEYSSIEELCESLNYDKQEIDNILGSIGYHYNSDLNQYKND